MYAVAGSNVEVQNGDGGSFPRKKKKDKAQQVTDRTFGSHRPEGRFESPFPFEITATATSVNEVSSESDITLQ
jgi:hypothetical protein